MGARQRHEEQAQPRRIGQHAEEHATEQAIGPGTLVMVFDGRAGVLDERGIADAGRTGRFARHAAEARVEVPGERRVDVDAVFDAGPHQVDPSTR
jgi:hypothetical protein